LLGIADDKAARFLSRAVSLDRGSFLARAGLGYAETKHIVDSSKQVFASNTAKDVGPWVHRLESEFRAHERHGLLRALGRIRNLPINEEGLRQEGKVGSANGLAVTAREGGLFPISVRIEPVEEKRDVVEEKKLTFDYWGDVRVREYQIESLNYPISFGDYGEKDPFMFISAIEAYKWLKSLSQTMEGLKVEFHELLVGKAGDSAGVTMAVAGHSVLNHVPIRQDVAMTGSIRSDGAVKAVGGVPNKVAGAYAAAGIELVIVPKENEPDLVFVPVDQLCRLTIVVAGDIKTYLKYAIQPTLGHISDDQQEADQITKRLQEAQARLLVGEIDEAVSLLEPIRNSNREIYSARRLLELIDIQRKAHIAETQYGGTTN
jgi:hypothetical protein